MAELMLVALIGAVLSLDSHAVAQVMVSRPLVCGALVGLLFGDPAIGLLIGVLLELVWIGKLPIGISIPSDITLPTVTAVVLSIHLKAAGVVYPAIMAILLALPFGFLSSLVDRFNREMMTVFARRVESRLVRGRERVLDLAIYGGLAFRLLTFFLVYFTTLRLQFLVAPHIAALPSFYYEDALEALQWLIPAVGLAAALRRFTARKGWYLGAVSFVAGMVMIQLGVNGLFLLAAVIVAGAIVLIKVRREDTG